MNGLVIKSPWIDRILATPRTWAIRGSRTSTRGTIALIKGRAGQIVGTCRIENCMGPLTQDELRAQAALQQTPVEVLTSSSSAKAFAWILSDVKPFAEPIPYQHPTGSVVWVKLTPQNVPARYEELDAAAPAATPVEAAPAPAESAPAAAPQAVAPDVAEPQAQSNAA